MKIFEEREALYAQMEQKENKMSHNAANQRISMSAKGS
jgi:hypothetical protein